MKTRLLTIFAVAISAVLTAGSPYASETSSLEADAVETADAQVDTEPTAAAVASTPEATAAAPMAADDGESAEMPQAEEIAESDVAAEADSAVAANDEEAIDPELPDATGEIDDAEVETSDAQPARKIPLGKIGYDEQGRSGRIHVVVPGDTLWDISDAYLGTPWVWPSVWTDNRDIENPHLIVPDDRIWISAHEMRRVSAEEAERLLSGQPRTADGEPTGPASDSFQSLFQDEGGPTVVRVGSRETSGLITAEQLEAAASIVDAVPQRVMLGQGDEVYIGLGDQQASVGDQFTVFRAEEEVFDPDTNRLLGHHVNLLGWVEVAETDAEASLAVIRMSAGEIGIGDRIMPRETPILDVEVRASPKNVDGVISFFPSDRVLMGSDDFVYLNRGELDGLQVGSPLEVYRAGRLAPEVARDTHVEVPDRVIAKLLVVRARNQSAVAVVRHTETELELGDHFRGALE